MTEQMRRKASISVATLVTPRYHYGAAGGDKKILDTTQEGRIQYNDNGTAKYKHVYREDAHPCKYKNREEALQALYPIYIMWINTHSNFEYPDFEKCVKDTGPECKEFNPLLKSVYLVIKPI